MHASIPDGPRRGPALGMGLFAKAFVLLLAIGSIAGCNDVAVVENATLALTVRDAGSDLPLAGFRICQLDATNCVETDAGGNASLVLPVGETGFTSEGEAYAPVLQLADVPPEGSSLRVGMLPDQFVSDVYDHMMSPYPMRGTGSILLRTSQPFAGVTFDLVNATGKPFYVEEDGYSWSTELTATTSFGYGGFAEVTPGDYQVKFGGTAEGCSTPVNSLPGDTENSVRVRVQEGYFTYASMACPPPR
jgi:hypothetical protein